MAIAPPNDTTILADAIRKGVQKQVEDRWEDYKKDFLEKLERDKNQIVAGIVLDVMAHVRYETRGTELLITVRKVDEKKP